MKNHLILPTTILLSSIILGGFYYASEASKQASIEKQQQIELQAKNVIEKNKVEQAKNELIEKNKLDTLKINEETLVKQQKEESDALINKCITDAYTELKTLQANFDVLKYSECISDHSKCGPSTDFWNKAKDDAFTTYKEEWVPQCKLGKRVFIHYKLDKLKLD